MSALEHRCPEVLVTDRAVFFDGLELPWYIAKDGVSFAPGGQDDINRLTVEFLVGETTFEDVLVPLEINYSVDWTWLERYIGYQYGAQLYDIEQLEKRYM